MDQSLEELEKQLKKLNARCAATTGLESYQSNDEKRKAILVEVQKHRSITRWEYICCYGYLAWLAYTNKHGLPEDHPSADQGATMYKVFLTIGRKFIDSHAVVESYSPNDLAKAAEKFWKSVPNAERMATQVLIWDQETEIPQNLLAVWSMFDQSQPLKLM
jgi:hypothetical protein